MARVEAWSLGTTAILQGGGYCVCAVDERGHVTYEAMKASANVPPGRVLEKAVGGRFDSNWCPTLVDDLPGLHKVAGLHARDWSFKPIPIVDAKKTWTGHWESRDIFSNILEWYPHGSYHDPVDGEANMPRSPGCWHRVIAQSCLTVIVRLKFQLEKRKVGDAYKYVAKCEEFGEEWLIKYNGQQPAAAPEILYENTLVAVFLSLGRYPQRYNPNTKYSEPFAHLKIGSILKLADGVERQVPCGCPNSFKSLGIHATGCKVRWVPEPDAVIISGYPLPITQMASDKFVGDSSSERSPPDTSDSPDALMETNTGKSESPIMCNPIATFSDGKAKVTAKPVKRFAAGSTKKTAVYSVCHWCKCKLNLKNVSSHAARCPMRAVPLQTVTGGSYRRSTVDRVSSRLGLEKKSSSAILTVHYKATSTPPLVATHADEIVCDCGNRMPQSSVAKHRRNGKCRPR
jgi:hypothetical protein